MVVTRRASSDVRTLAQDASSDVVSPSKRSFSRPSYGWKTSQKPSPRVDQEFTDYINCDDGLVDEAHEEAGMQWPSRPRLCDGASMTSKLQYYTPPRRMYSRRELLADRIVNFAGAAFSWFATAAICMATSAAGDPFVKQLGFWAHGLGLIVMLNFSALYHWWSWDWKSSHKLLSLDHVGITSMIMGCYAPLMLYTGCYRVLAVVWLLGAAGFCMEGFKLASGRYELSGGGGGGWTPFDMAHLARYVVMGWACVVVAPSMASGMPSSALVSTVVAGLLYTGGIPFLIMSSLEFHLTIWHFFVFVASVIIYSANFLVLVG